MRKALCKALSVAALLLSIAGCLYFTNREYFSGNRAEGSHLPLSQVQLDHWAVNDSGYLSLVDPQIILPSLNAYVNQIQLLGDFDELDQPLVYYTTGSSEGFSEDRVVLAAWSADEDGLRFEIGMDVYSLRIDLVEAPGFSMRLDGVVCSPASFQFPVVTVLLLLVCLGILLLPLHVSTGAVIRFPVLLQNFKRYLYLLKNLVTRDFVVKYRRSVLGVVWSILNPLLMMMVITSVFQHLFRFQVENFPVYYLTGSLLFNFASEATSSAMTSIVSAGPLIRKVYVPKYIFPLEKCFFSLVNMFFSFIAVLIMLPILRVQISWTILFFFIPVLLLFVFCVGLGMVLASLNVFFRDTSHLYSVWITAWMYLTPVIYPVEILPLKVLMVVKLNPLYYYVEYFRDLVMYRTFPSLETNLICICFSIISLGVGIFVFKKKQDRFILFI